MKIKTLIFLSLVGLSLSRVSAQGLSDTNSGLYLGGGRTFTGNGDYNGVMLYTQYMHSLNNYWGVTPRLSFAMGKSGQNYDPNVVGSGLYSQFSAMALDLDMNYFPFPKIFNKISASLSVGPSVRYLIETRPISAVVRFDEQRNERILEADYRQNVGFSLGITFGVNLTANISNRYLIGVRGSAQAYTDGNLVPFYGLVFGYKL